MNASPDGLNIGELLEDRKELNATFRKQGRKIAELDQPALPRRVAQLRLGYTWNRPNNYFH